MKKNLLKLFAVVLAVSLALVSLSLTVGATADELQITVGKVQGYANRDVDVAINIDQNPGITSLTLVVSYGSGLTLNSVTDGGILGDFVSEEANYDSPYTLAWANDLATENFTATGTLATLHFTIAEDATGTQDITVTTDTNDDSVMDKDLNTDIAYSISAGSVTVNAATWTKGGTCEDGGTVDWNIYNTNTLIISGSGKMPTYKAGKAPWYGDASKITTLIIEDGVTAIGGYNFYKLSALTNVSIADSVTSIGTAAFYYCTKLAGIELPQTLTTLGGFVFYACTSLTELTIPANVKAVGNSLCAYCTALTTVEMQGTVASIGNNSFFKCTSLNKVIFADTVKSIGNFAFRDCTALENIVFNEGLETISDYAFYTCSALKCIILPSTIKTIGKYAFYHQGGSSANSTFIVIPTGFTSFGAGAFYDNASVMNVYYGGTSSTKAADWANMASVGGSVVALTPNYIVASGACGDEITWALYDDGTMILNGNGAMPNYATAAGTPWNAYASQIKKVVVAGYIETIGKNAFAGCASLNDIQLASEFCTEIKTNAFTGCGFTKLTVPTKLTTVADGAFDAIPNVYYEDTEANMNEKAVVISATNAHYAVQNGTTGDAAIWTLYENGELVISGAGATGTYTSKAPAPWKTYAADITKVTVKPGVVKLSGYNFTGLTALTTVELADSVNTIGPSAFNGCTVLETINMPSKLSKVQNYAFKGCASLSTIEFPEKVTAVDANAFKSCTSLTSVVFDGEKNVSLGVNVFDSCTKLTNVVLPAKQTAISNYAFAYTALTGIALPDTLTTIGERAFYSTKLTTLEIPSTVTAIGANAVPSTLTSVKARMTEAELNDALGATTNTVLRGSSKAVITKAIAYGKETTGNLWTLWDTNELEISGSNAMGSYSSSAAKLAPWNAYAADVKTVTIKGGVKTVAGYAFYNMTAVETINIGEGATTIGGSAFRGCTSLATISLPSTLTSIATYAFLSCSALTTADYAGTAAQWAKVSVGANGNTTFTALTVNTK